MCDSSFLSIPLCVRCRWAAGPYRCQRTILLQPYTQQLIVEDFFGTLEQDRTSEEGTRVERFDCVVRLNAIKTYTIRSKAHGKEQTKDKRKRRAIIITTTTKAAAAPAIRTARANNKSNIGDSNGNSKKQQQQPQQQHHHHNNRKQATTTTQKHTNKTAAASATNQYETDNQMVMVEEVKRCPIFVHPATFFKKKHFTNNNTHTFA